MREVATIKRGQDMENALIKRGQEMRDAASRKGFLMELVSFVLLGVILGSFINAGLKGATAPFLPAAQSFGRWLWSPLHKKVFGCAVERAKLR